jgi:hypothetical protein
VESDGAVAAALDPQVIPGNCAGKMPAATKTWIGVLGFNIDDTGWSRLKLMKNQWVT